MAQKPSLIHIPRPGTHYSAARGSAISTVIYEMARAAQKQGVSTRVILKRGVTSEYEVGESAFVAFGDLPRRWQRRVDDRLAKWKRSRFFMPRFLEAALDAIEPEFTGFVFFHDSLEALYDMKKARPNAKICTWFHNYKWRHLHPWELKLALTAAHRVICISQFVADALIAECSAHCHNLKEKVAVVFNGVDIERFRPSEDNNKQQSGSLSIAFAGRIIEKKGVHLLLEAAQMLQAEQRTQDFKVRLIGSKSIRPGEELSPYERELHQRSQSLGDRVQWVGTVAHDMMASKLAENDIICVPSVWDEPFSLVTLEAMACGVAVVASNRGGIPEVGGNAILLFEGNSSESLALNLARLIEDRELRDEMKIRARKRALELTWDDSFLSLQNQVL